MRLKKIYLDNAATTKVDEKVLEAMKPYFIKEYANPSSAHTSGIDAKESIEKARKTIAKSINAQPEEIIFTSGGTESNNFALKSIAFTNKKKHIITTKVEHKCVLNSCKWLENQGFEVTYLDVDKEGFISLEDLKSKIRKDTILVSVIHGNNEIGTINDIEEIGKICKDNKIYFHTDACQSYTKTEIDVQKQNIDLITLNSHKIHGPKGVGALYIRKGTEIESWQHGGGHEFNLRSGTENVPGIVGFAEAVKQSDKKKHTNHISKIRNKLISGILEIPGTNLNGSDTKRLCNNTNFLIEDIAGDTLGAMLDSKNISSSTGSACSEASSEPSYVLKAIGLDNKQAEASIRLTLSRYNTEEEIDYTIKLIKKFVKKLRKPSFLDKIS
ncbi:MAG: cysteine desulfurase family protein [Nanobdellota archaeon]